MRIVDLSRELYHRTPSYPGQPPIIHGIWKTHEEAFADSGNIQGYRCAAPFRQERHADRQISAENCIVQGVCTDFRHIPPRAEIIPADLEAAVKKAGTPIPKKGTVLLCTGHHAHFSEAGLAPCPRRAPGRQNSK